MLVKQDNYFFISYGLKDNKTYQGHVFSYKKGDLVFNFLDSGLLYTFSSFYCQNLLETRFWLYNNFLDFESKKFIFCLKKIDNFKTLKMEAKRLKKFKTLPHVLLYNLRRFVISSSSRKLFVKSRVLMLTKKGYVLKFLGLNALLEKNVLLMLLRKNQSYVYWFFLNLHFIGFLNLFYLIRWTIYSPDRYNSFLRLKNIKGKYYKNNKVFSIITLGKKLKFNE
jgi:hypothetical protein